MRGSGVTAARSCLQPLVSASRYLAVHALPGDPLYFVVEVRDEYRRYFPRDLRSPSWRDVISSKIEFVRIIKFADPLSIVPTQFPKQCFLRKGS